MKMAASAIPRFLLPQLTWRKTLPGILAKFGPSPAGKHEDYNRPQISKIAKYKRQQRWRLAARPGAWDFPSTVGSDVLKISRALSRLRQRGVVGSTSFCGLVSHRSFHAGTALCRDHHFDTLKFVQRLKDEGFSEEQATAMMRVLSDVIEESIQNLTRTMVLREGSQLVYTTLPVVGLMSV